MHSASKPLEFLKLFNITLPEKDLELDIKLSDSEIAIAKADLKNLLEKNSISQDSKVIALFRNARFDKKIADEWWKEWYRELKKLNRDVVVIDILSPDITTKLEDDFLTYQNKNLRVLGAFFRACNLYVSADTGPLHLAASAGAKSLALFNKTDINTYGTIGDLHKTVDINNLLAKDVAEISHLIT
jgi:ADP-heptose:LPS heptosyltransferase